MTTATFLQPSFDLELIEFKASHSSPQAPQALFELAVVHFFANEEKKAFEAASKAAYQGHTEALTFIGDAYLWGKGVIADKAKALKLLDRAAKQGCEAASFTLKKLYA